MVERLQKQYFKDILIFLKENRNPDFYFTDNNIRKYIIEESDLKYLIKTSKYHYCCLDRGDVIGIILVWNSIGNNVSRGFVKLHAINEKIADNLLSVLLWNCKQDLYTKIKKNSKFLNIFRNKNFKFIGDRGKELLLLKSKFSQEKTNGEYKKQNPLSVG